MTTSTNGRTYSIREAATLTGLPASTLRYYESIGVIEPIGRGATSGHRVYDEDDLDRLTSVACLAATGMSITDMRDYVANNRIGRPAAGEQIELLTARAERLEIEAAQIALRTRYVRLKIEYWNAVAAGDDARAGRVGAESIALADEINRTDHS